MSKIDQTPRLNDGITRGIEHPADFAQRFSGVFAVWWKQLNFEGFLGEPADQQYDKNVYDAANRDGILLNNWAVSQVRENRDFGMSCIAALIDKTERVALQVAGEAQDLFITTWIGPLIASVSFSDESAAVELTDLAKTAAASMESEYGDDIFHFARTMTDQIDLWEDSAKTT